MTGRAYWEEAWDVTEALEEAGMDSALKRHSDRQAAGDMTPCGKGWCELCWWHPHETWGGPGYRPVWFKAPVTDLFTWGALQ